MWDYDTGMSNDFIGYALVSVEELQAKFEAKDGDRGIELLQGTSLHHKRGGRLTVERLEICKVRNPPIIITTTTPPRFPPLHRCAAPSGGASAAAQDADHAVTFRNESMPRRLRLAHVTRHRD